MRVTIRRYEAAFCTYRKFVFLVVFANIAAILQRTQFSFMLHFPRRFNRVDNERNKHCNASSISVSNIEGIVLAVTCFRIGVSTLAGRRRHNYSDRVSAARSEKRSDVPRKILGDYYVKYMYKKSACMKIQSIKVFYIFRF